MFAFKRLSTALSLLFLANPAQAIDHWTITDLGSTRTESLCVDVASDTLLSFSHVFGASKILRSTWTVYGYGLNNSEHDAVVTCTFATANATRATLIVYSEHTINGGLVSNRLAQRFREMNEIKEAEWLAEAHARMGY